MGSFFESIKSSWQGLWSRASGDPNDINTVPQGGSGTKRLNKLPIIIVLLLVTLAIAAIFQQFVFTPDAKKGKEEQSTAVGAKGEADKITANAPAAYIKAKVPDLPKVPEPVTPPAEQPIVAEKPLPPPPEIEMPKVRMPSELEFQLWNKRFQNYQQALSSRMAVGMNGVTRGSENGRQNTALPRVSAINEETANYQRQLAMLRQRANGGGSSAGVMGLGTGAGTSRIAGDLELNPEARGNNPANYDQHNRWSLPNRVEAPDTPYLIHAGFIMPAVMINGINSDLPGQVIGQISRDVYDSISGKYLLIPQGTRLLGTYNNSVAYGQNRLFMVWQRLIFPDGRTLDIGGMPGADAMGQAGASDDVDNHYFRIFGSAILLSGVTAGVTLSQDDAYDTNNNKEIGNRARNALSQSLGNVLGNTMSQLITKNMNIAPTIMIRPGFRMNVMAIKDLRFEGPYRAFSY